MQYWLVKLYQPDATHVVTHVIQARSEIAAIDKAEYLSNWDSSHMLCKKVKRGYEVEAVEIVKKIHDNVNPTVKYYEGQGEDLKEVPELKEVTA